MLNMQYVKIFICLEVSRVLFADTLKMIRYYNQKMLAYRLLDIIICKSSSANIFYLFFPFFPFYLFSPFFSHLCAPAARLFCAQERSAFLIHSRLGPLLCAGFR